MSIIGHMVKRKSQKLKYKLAFIINLFKYTELSLVYSLIKKYTQNIEE